jgi:hypothetical protein
LRLLRGWRRWLPTSCDERGKSRSDDKYDLPHTLLR